MLISEYQDGFRKSSVYKTTNNKFMVLVYSVDDDYENSKLFDFIDMAEDFAEDWVNGDVTL